MMAHHKPKATRLRDYSPPPFLVDSVELRVELDASTTRVASELQVRRNPDAALAKHECVLNGRDVALCSLRLDGQLVPRERYQVDHEHLIIDSVPEEFVLAIETDVQPKHNSSLEGLYQSGEILCTQCEAEGFRKITYFPDRPDVMARYRVTLVADRSDYPVLLSNGNREAAGVLDDGRHWATWRDPFPKPCYLFALVAGKLACLTDRFRTRSGRDVALSIYVEPHNVRKCDHAMRALKKAMQWDEQVYGLEYDLDDYMIVAVDDFNMGAMENKGLNVFNSKCVLANADTATDNDFAAIEEVIAHEYFHNWTGNRVTCRDWFQLSLKEGLTVFRDQQFSADMTAKAVKRIQDVRLLRNHQFPEDAGPLAHPVRPDSYIEISNFYTATVYNKGAEVVRMVHTLLGEEGFRRGLARYLQRHDGRAATTEDFIAAMEQAGATDLGQFRRWYTQAGTPELAVAGAYDTSKKQYTLTVEQTCSSSPGQPEKQPLHIPLAVALLDGDGKELPLRLAGEPAHAREQRSRVLSVRQPTERFLFVDVPTPPTPSLLRGFSAPVRLHMQYTDTELAFLLAQDPDPFSRWEASQALAVKVMLRLIETYQAHRSLHLDDAFAAALSAVIEPPVLDKGLAAEVLTLPSESYLATLVEVIDVDAIHAAREFVRQLVARTLTEQLLATYRANEATTPYQFTAEAAGRRRLRNLCLDYLMTLDQPRFRELCMEQFTSADNMTDRLAALGSLANTACPQREQAFDLFHNQWRHDPLVLDKWFSLQATSNLPDTLERVESLTRHPGFSLANPNRVRALIGAFSQHNPVRFHDASGAGYRFLVDRALELDPVNPQIAARLLTPLTRWRQFDDERAELMRQELERLVSARQLSRDTYEIASKTLADTT